jgi:hypothetical protein
MALVIVKPDSDGGYPSTGRGFATTQTECVVNRDNTSKTASKIAIVVSQLYLAGRVHCS